jgi:hypothetical protein
LENTHVEEDPLVVARARFSEIIALNSSPDQRRAEQVEVERLPKPFGTGIAGTSFGTTVVGTSPNRVSG